MNDWASFSESCRIVKVLPSVDSEKYFWNGALRIAELILLYKSRNVQYIPGVQLVEYQRSGTLNNNFLSTQTELKFIRTLPKEFANLYNHFHPNRCFQTDNALYDNFKQVKQLYTGGARPLETLLANTEASLAEDVREAI